MQLSPLTILVQKRKQVLKDFQEFTETEPLKLLRHCSTRWLSLERCVRKLLQQLAALKSYFNSHEECEKFDVSRDVPHFYRIQRWSWFIEFIMGPLNEFNTTFQVSLNIAQADDDTT